MTARGMKAFGAIGLLLAMIHIACGGAREVRMGATDYNLTT